MRGSYRVAAAVVVGALTTLTSCATPSEQPLGALNHSVVAGALLGSRELIDTVSLDNNGSRPLTLDAATLTTPQNVRVAKAVVITADDRNGIEGVLRWPRPESEKDSAFNVLDTAKPAEKFVLPAHSHAEWALTLFVAQVDLTRSIRAAGMTVTYTVDGKQRTLDLPQGFCFSTPSDRSACNDK